MTKVKILDEDQKQLRPIEFIYEDKGKREGGRKTRESAIRWIDPHGWDNVHLVCKSQSENYYDIMFAFDDYNRSGGVIYYGYWNDGVIKH